MQTLARKSNPFALMLDPQSVLALVEHSERLEKLQRRICRPLDQPIALTDAAADVGEFDKRIDDSDEGE